MENKVSDLSQKVKKTKGKAMGKNKNAKTSKTKEASNKQGQSSANTDEMEISAARFTEDDNIVDMEVEGINSKFLSLSEEELEVGELVESENNNAMVLKEITKVQLVQGHIHGDVNKSSQGIPNTCENQLEQSIALLQGFLIKKGLMSEEELSEILPNNKEVEVAERGANSKTTEANTAKKTKVDTNKRVKGIDFSDTGSEIMIYHRAVNQIPQEGTHIFVIWTEWLRNSLITLEIRGGTKSIG